VDGLDVVIAMACVFVDMSAGGWRDVAKKFTYCAPDECVLRRLDTPLHELPERLQHQAAPQNVERTSSTECYHHTRIELLM
jgi:hypothetical protein